MKKVYISLLLLVTCCFTASAFNSDSTQQQAGAFSNNKTLDKQIAKQLKLISKTLAVKATAKADGLSKVEWLTQTECTIKREIEYTDACGVVSTNIELLYAAKKALPNDTAIAKIGPAAVFLVNAKQMQVQKTALYQPRCEGGKFTPGSYNLKWFDTKGKQIQLP